jgi:hypothetical protein
LLHQATIHILFATAAAALPALTVQAQSTPQGPIPYSPVLVWDTLGEAVVRRTDLGADGAVGVDVHQVPDLVGYQIGRWAPTNATTNIFAGTWSLAGAFFRIDVGFAGVANPPGTLALSGESYSPYLYGPNPVFGFIEMDMDSDVNTGGETAAPDVRYLANVARFGGKPATPRFANRVALNGPDADQAFNLPPWVQRSGEEFHIALFGDDITQVTELSGDGDGVFEAAEIWNVRGRLFHRAHGYEEFSFSEGPPPGSYMPIVDLRWEHVPALAITIVTLVYPLTQNASAQQLNDGEVEPLDGSVVNQHSIEEALDDLIFSVQVLPVNDPNRFDPEFPLIANWENRTPQPYFGAHGWDLNLLVGMAYLAEDPSGAILAWTDVQDEPLFGDVNGSAGVTFADVNAINGFVAAHDGDVDVDGGAAGDAQVELTQFGWNFSVYDLNYDGLVNGLDAMLAPVLGDVDVDNDIDLDDAAVFSTVLCDPQSLNLPADYEIIVPRADFTRDGLLNGADMQGFVRVLLGL